MSKMMDKLDAEIAELEGKISPPSSPEGTQAAEVTASPTPSFTLSDDEMMTEPVSPPPSDPIPEGLPTPVESAVEEQKKKRVNWKSRYTKLRSATDASKYKDRQTISEAYNKITSLEREAITMRSKIQELTVASPTSVRDLATEEEINVIGDEGISSIDKITKRAVDNAIAPLQDQLAKQEADRIASYEVTASTARQSAYNAFLDRLTKAVPNYPELDEDPGFAEYLSHPDPDSGVRRIDHFKQAESTGDVGRVAYYFKGYAATKAPSPNDLLKAKVTPVGNGISPQEVVTNDSQKVYRLADYNKFMDDITKGKYRGKQSLADSIESEFDKAIVEGRMV